MATLFDHTIINGMSLENRMVRSATWEGMCDPDGRPGQRLAPYYRTLAEGGVGLIISGYTFVRPDGKQLPGKMGIHDDAFADDFKKLTRTVHEAGGKIVIQLVHAGGQANPKATGTRTVAPSAVKVDQFPEMPEELSVEGIHDIIRAFGDGARRAKEWGFDGVQLHGAHGYLINQFLSPQTNLRRDDYGGSVENRRRFLMEAYQEVREATGSDFPVMIKLNIGDNLEGGLDTEEALLAVNALSDAGIDAIEVSSGTSASGDKTPARKKINRPDREAYNLEMACLAKKAAACPIMSVGGFRSWEICEKAVSESGLDYIAMSRPLIREPDLPNQWRQGNRSPARCVSCNSCFGPGLEEGGIYCVPEKKESSGKNKSE